MRNIDWAITGTAAVLLAGVGASLVTIVSLTWTPELSELTGDYLRFRDGGEEALGEKPDAIPPMGSFELAEVPNLTDPGARPSTRVEDPMSGVASETAILGQKGELTEDLGGLIGMRGDALGGGGTAEGLGGLGTKGIGLGGGGSARGYGRGSSGYGRGGGSFGAKGSARLSGGTVLGAAGGLSRSEIGPGMAGIQESTAVGGVNGFVQAGRDRLSTFAVDVDTGSYTLSRSLLRGGALPRPEQVRVEEFVNAMDYQLAPPTSGNVPFAVASEAAPHPTEEHHVLLRVALKGEVPEPHSRASRLTFLVDTSCSMTEELPLVKNSLHTLADHAGPEDSIAIATYAGGTSMVLAPTPTTQRETIHRAIDSLSNGGGTAMGSGMELAYDMAQKSYVDGAENRVVVLSDGDANIGATSHDQILAGIREHAGTGITMSAVGFGGANYRDGLMEQLADNGDGNYVYIDGPREAQRVFGEGLAATMTTIARDVKIQVAFDTDAVRAWRLVGYENRDVADEDFRNDAVDGGEIGAGHEVTALYELVLADELPDRIGHVYLRAKPPGPDAPAQEWTVPIRSSQVRGTWTRASHDLRVAASAALLAEKLRNSPFVEELAYEQIASLLRPVPASENVRELRELIGRADQLSSGAPAAPAEAAVLPDLAQRSVGMEVIRRHMNRFRYCYQRQLVRNPSLAGSVTMVVQVGVDGRVQGVQANQGTLQAPEVSQCIVGQARRMRFPSNSPQRLSVDLSFAP